ncbi:lycopene cyclase family protein [Aurantibacter sp.]|uniref:lycopene cyclase family protein n=1 Tax=Aurantibacter sp. TaxID=2807103 RepID=UPI0035C87E65
MKQNHFDYIIIGQGLAGLKLALSFKNDVFFKDKKIALIDKDSKRTNDKTWCFWETSTNSLEHLVSKKWSEAKVYGNKKCIKIALKPYNYKMIKSLDFYNYAKKTLKENSNFYFISENVFSTNNSTITVITDKNRYTSNHIFDSRIPEEFHLKKENYINIIQHFKGWVITTKTNHFNPDEITMMDYRLKDGNKTSFMYVLPFSRTEALVEFTYFTDEVVSDKVYDKFLKKYISEQLKITDYKIKETEKGQIPMSTFPFEDYSTKNITKIGTAGGWVKGSTGYSFKHTEKKVSKILQNIKDNQLPSKGLINAKYKFYDKIFLKVLLDENNKGEWVFTNYYSKNNIKTMFRFLDEESTLLEDLKIMWSLFSFSFIKAFLKTLKV